MLLLEETYPSSGIISFDEMDLKSSGSGSLPLGNEPFYLFDATCDRFPKTNPPLLIFGFYYIIVSSLISSKYWFCYLSYYIICC